MTIRSSRLPALLLCLFAAAACGDPPERVGKEKPAPPSGTTAQMSTIPIFQGEVRLSGDLAAERSGFVFVMARMAGTRAPILIKKLSVALFKAEGEDKVLAYELTDADFMGGMKIALPPKMEIKFQYDPDGMVETQAGREELVVLVQEGETRYDALLSKGMAKPDEPPSSIPAQD